MSTGRNSTATIYATQHRLDTAAMQTLLGICTGISADELIHDKEIIFLKTWLKEHAAVAMHWPGSTIAGRIDAILADGIISQDERENLLALLREITGNHFSETGAALPESPALPIDDDPSIYFRHMTFCFTGNFYFGTRAACERAILRMGGTAMDRVSKKLNYLIIGGLIEPTWAHGTFGRKIEQAMHYKERDADITIASEQQWTQAIADAARL